MSIVFDTADKNDINELIRMRIAYMADDFGSVSDIEKESMESSCRIILKESLIRNWSLL